jgi:hypothetical protein
MRKLVTIAIAVGALLLPAGAAWARGDGWQLIFVPDTVDVACGSTTVHLTWPVNQEYFRNLPQPDGTIVQQISGNLTINYATDAGASLTVNTSGPAKNVIYPNGDYEVSGQGLNTGQWSPEQAEQFGMPEVWWTSGPLDFIIHPDGSVTLITVPPHVTDICAELGI